MIRFKLITIKKSVTLLELILAIVLMSVLIFSFSNIDMVSRKNVISLERRGKVQNAVTYCLGQMSKNIGSAIGDKNNPPITRIDIDGNAALQVRVDTDMNGKLDNSTIDKQIAYSYNPAAYELRFFSNYTDDPVNYEVLSNKIVSNLNSTYVIYNTTNNYLEVDIQGRWDPGTNTSVNNPQVDMRTSVNMPSVSVN